MIFRLLVVTAGVLALAACDGRPDQDAIAKALRAPLEAGLKIRGFEIPSRFVELKAVDLREMKATGERDGAQLYRASGVADVQLRARGTQIAEELLKEARSLSVRQAIALEAKARMMNLALDDVEAGGYQIAFVADLSHYRGDISVVSAVVDDAKAH